MPVKFSASQFHSYNKPQPYPQPKPPYELFPTVLTLSSGRKVRVSVPVPDRLVILVDISKEIFGPTAPEGCTVAMWVKGVGDYLKQGPGNTDVLGDKYFPGPPPWYKEVALGMGKRGSRVQFEFTKAKGVQPAQMRIVMNPRKLGPNGFKSLIKILSDPKGPFSIKPLLKMARYTDLDVAVDVVGVQTSEIVAFRTAEGKRSHYIGADGVLETINIHRGVKPSKPAGTVAVIIYDRRRERLDRGKHPPFGLADVTRVEISTKGAKPNNALVKLLEKSDPFKGLRVGFAPDQLPMSAAWETYLSLVRTMPQTSASKIMGLNQSSATSFEKALLVPNASLVAHGLNWKGWPEGLKFTGLQLLLDAAT